MSDLLQSVQAWQLLMAVLLAFSESALGLGAILPGELAITALATTLDDAPARWLAVVALAIGASTGDHVGYLLGSHFGDRLRGSRVVQRVGQTRWDAAATLVRRRGAPAVLISRLLPFVRTVMPAVAGAAGLRYSHFAVASVAGSVIWATMWVSAGGVVNALAELPGAVGGVFVAGLVAAIVVWVGLRALRAGGSSSGSVDDDVSR